MKTGNSAYKLDEDTPASFGSGGGNSGAVVSPAPKLGLSAYQNPGVPVKPAILENEGAQYGQI